MTLNIMRYLMYFLFCFSLIFLIGHAEKSIGAKVLSKEKIKGTVMVEYEDGVLKELYLIDKFKDGTIVRHDLAITKTSEELSTYDYEVVLAECENKVIRGERVLNLIKFKVLDEEPVLQDQKCKRSFRSSEKVDEVDFYKDEL